MRNNFQITALARRNVLELSPYSSARDEFTGNGKEMTFLDANENPFDNGFNRYPDPYQRELKFKLALIKNVEATQILFGNGSDEVIDLVLRVFCEPGVDNIITLPPTYGMYSVLAGINNIEERKVLLDNDFQPSVDDILQTTDSNSKVIFLCSPNNPTGNSFSENLVESILKNFKGVVVVDEAYIDFSKKPSWLLRLNEFPNLVIIQTFSKAYGQAGIRLGVGYASKEIITLIHKIKPPYNINILTQKRALEILQSEIILESEVTQILAQRKILEIELSKIKFIRKVYPSDANFILIKVDDADRRYTELISRGLVVRNRSSQQLCENCLRLTIGTKNNNLKLLKAIREMEI